MKPYAVFDLHCDTLTAFMDTPDTSLDRPEAALSLSGIPHGVHWCQCLAVFLPDGLSPEERLRRYQSCRSALHRQAESRSDTFALCRSAAQVEQAWAQNRAAGILTIENGSLLAGNLNRAAQLAEDGVRMMTLTWNGVNEIGSGHVSDRGLTDFGKALIPTMEELGMIVDVSHLNDPGFDDLLKVAEKPFAASHSNARSVCGHKRNLTDSQIREMVDRRCLIGLNFYTLFLRDDGKPRPEDILRHADHILELGGEDLLALGSDFDGADLPGWLCNMEGEAALARLFLDHGFSAELVDKLMYRNALEFWRRNLPEAD